MASPMPALSPWPSEPVATSTKFRRGVGWPSRSESKVLRRNSSSGLNAPASAQDRKSTRLNSSHLVISYAVFCLKKKKNRKLIKLSTRKNSIEKKLYVAARD